MSSVTRSLFPDLKTTAVRLACTVMVSSLAACSTIEHWWNSDKVDYRSNSRQTQGLDVPPDLTQLSGGNRNQVQGGVVSASALQQAANRPAPTAAPSSTAVAGVAPLDASAGPVALKEAAGVRLERAGATRWLHTPMSAEQVWPLLRKFWEERNVPLIKDEPAIGTMDTDWFENRDKVPTDIIRRTLGKVFDSLYSSDERDMYRVRVERANDGGSDIFVNHYGKQEIYTSSQRDQTSWQNRPSDPLLEAEILSRILVKLGGKEDEVKAAMAAAAPVKPKNDGEGIVLYSSGAPAPAPARAAIPSSELPQGNNARTRALSEVPSSLQINDGFERAWRRVGQSLDRHGFTVEDRDRNLGLFFLRYADPTQAGKEEPNFFERLFKGEKAVTASRYRVAVKSEGERSTVTVLDSKGQQQTDENAKRILNLLMDDLR
jgi:outer membrane protein assembly factor BamC